MLKWADEQGYALSNLRKSTVADILLEPELPSPVRRLLELRQSGAGAAPSKLVTLRRWVDDQDHRIRHAYRYHGASSGRFTSLGVQLHNLKRCELTDVAGAIAAVQSGSLQELRARGFEPPLDVIGQLARAFPTAAPGMRFFCGDLSGIEARSGAYTVGDRRELEQWRTFDRTGRREDEPYYLAGRKTFHQPPETARPVGKGGYLAFQYQGGVGAYRRITRDLTTSDEIVDQRKLAWRAAHPLYTQFWRTSIFQAVQAIRNPGMEFTLKGVAFRYDQRTGFLELILPSGRVLSYPQAEIFVDEQYGSVSFTFFDASGGGAGKMYHERKGSGAFGGLMLENITQGICRDIFVEAMLKLEAAGYRVVAHTHDDYVVEVPEDFGALAEFVHIITTPPSWAVDLPIAAKARAAGRFVEIPEPTQIEVIVTDNTLENRREQLQEEVEELAQIETTAEIADKMLSEPPPVASTPSPEPELEPAHVCAQCRLDPPDGSEQLSTYSGAWLHERCRDAFIRARMAQEGIPWAAAAAAQPSPAAAVPPPAIGTGATSASALPPLAVGNGGTSTPAFPPPIINNDRGSHSSDGNLHGDNGQQRGRRTAQWLYPHLDWSNYLLIDRYDLPSGERKFYQHHWNGTHWAYGVKGTYAERKIPYRLPQLKAALQADPNVEVQICEGESDTDALARLGFVATTNPGGALSWTPELTDWLRTLGVRRAAIHEDNDGKAQGYKSTKRSALLIKELAGFIELKIVRYPDVPEGEDVRWWLEHGHTKAELEARIAATELAGSITAEPYQFCAEADITPWQWLYGRHLLRGEVSSSAAMGGTGKSTLSIIEALAMASGFALLGAEVPTPLRVVLVNLEDTRNTMDKRIAAAMRYYGLTPADIGDRLILKAKGEIKIKVARQLRSGDVERNEATIRALVKLMVEQHADVLSIDSFIRTHQVNENDNSAMQAVVECFEDITTAAQCAVHLWHHTRKGGGERATIEAARGAIAFIDACRSVRILETMSEKEREQLLDIQPDLLPPGFYFRAFNGKRNFAPPADLSEWFKLASVVLQNNDEVGVTTAWTYPAEATADITLEIADRILADLDRGTADGRRYTNHNRATRRQAWPVVRRHCPLKTESQCRRIIATWLKRGPLYEDEYQDPTQHRPQIGLFVRKPMAEAQAEDTED